MHITYHRSPDGQGVEPTGTIHNFDLSGLSFHLGHDGPRSTRDFTLQVVQPRLVLDEYLSYEVFVDDQSLRQRTLKLAGVRILGGSVHRHGAEDRCVCDMAVPMAVVQTIADELCDQVPADTQFIFKSREKAINGTPHAVFPAFLDYYTERGGRGEWVSAESRDFHGAELPSGAFKDLLERYHSHDLIAAVAFKITLAYKGTQVAELSTEPPALAIRLQPRAVCLSHVVATRGFHSGAIRLA